MGSEYYIVVRYWYTDKYDGGTMEIVKVFTNKVKADKYCKDKNKKAKKNIKERYEVATDVK